MTDLQALAAKVEAAEGPSYVLDCEIALAILPSEWSGSPVIGWFVDGLAIGCNTEDGWRHLDVLRVKPFCGNRAAAASLKLPEHSWAAGDLNENGSAWACVTADAEPCPDFASEAATPELALCAAALRARAAGGGRTA